MRDCEQILKKFKVKNEVLIVSAHRTPERLFKFAKIYQDGRKSFLWHRLLSPIYIN